MSDGTDDQYVAGPRPTEISLRQRMRDVATSVAAIEDWIADTLERLASVRPHDAARLRARAADARSFAAEERVRAAQYARGCGEVRPR
jgi:hypothetical protein